MHEKNQNPKISCYCPFKVRQLAVSKGSARIGIRFHIQGADIPSKGFFIK